jgi:hypothetical protein
MWRKTLSAVLLSLAAAGPLAAQRADAGAPTHAHPGYHLEDALERREVRLMDGAISLYVAPAAVGKPFVLEYEGRKWTFSTPRGRRTVLSKARNPVWTPPDWHYVELAALKHWQIVWLRPGDRVPLGDGGRVVVRGDRVGFESPDGRFTPVPTGEEIVHGDTLFAPPPGSRNRAIPGELGRFKLDLGDGYYIHGTPDAGSIGGALTHGCIRLADDDLEWLYEHVPAGTPVYID